MSEKPNAFVEIKNIWASARPYDKVNQSLPLIRKTLLEQTISSPYILNLMNLKDRIEEWGVRTGVTGEGLHECTSCSAVWFETEYDYPYCEGLVCPQCNVALAKRKTYEDVDA